MWAAHVILNFFLPRRKELLHDRNAAVQVIETLDRRKGFEQSFLWPQPDTEAAEESDDKADATAAEELIEVADPEPTWEDQPVRDKLVTALRYLRTHHFYCLHCGAQVRESLWPFANN